MEIGDVIAQNLRELRTERGLSLGKLAAQCDVSKVMLSQIEKGDSNPTINTLMKISKGLGVPYSLLLEQRVPEATVVRRAQASVQPDNDDHYRIHGYFNVAENRDFELFAGEFDPGCDHVSEGHRANSREYVYLFEGRLELVLGDETFALDAGDMVGFDSSRRHEYRNVGDCVAKVLFVNHYPA